MELLLTRYVNLVLRSADIYIYMWHKGEIVMAYQINKRKWQLIAGHCMTECFCKSLVPFVWCYPYADDHTHTNNQSVNTSLNRWQVAWRLSMLYERCKDIFYENKNNFHIHKIFTKTKPLPAKEPLTRYRTCNKTNTITCWSV